MRVSDYYLILFFSFITWRKEATFWWDDGHFVPDQHCFILGFFSASSVKQQSPGTHVAPLGHIYPDDYEPTSFCSYSFYVACLAEK
jgi:hypothetical protein